jgi:hypothetical protein
VLLLCTLLVLLPVALIVLFVYTDRIVSWLPHSTAFVVAVLACVGLALGAWMLGFTGKFGAAEREIYLRAARRLALWLRTKQERV